MLNFGLHSEAPVNMRPTCHTAWNGKATATVRKISDYEYRVVEKSLNTTSWLDRHNTFSKDGKVRTSRVIGVNPKGEKIDRLLTFDRR
jgi:hypothetical protein